MDNHPTRTDLRASTRLACEIAGIKPDRFNEAVHANFYPCAPKTTPGKARSFDTDDVVALRIYQRALNSGMSAAAAGDKACRVREFMQCYPDASRVFIVATNFSMMDRFLPEFDATADHLMINRSQSIDVIGCEVINLDWHRMFVVRDITHEDKHRVVGD